MLYRSPDLTQSWWGLSQAPRRFPDSKLSLEDELSEQNERSRDEGS